LAAVVEGTEDAIITVDRQGMTTSWNLGAEALFGYRADEVVGRPIARLIPADEIAHQTAIMARVAGGEQVDHYETRRLRKDGVEIDVSLTISPLRGIDDSVIGASKIARDITQRKRMETELLLHRDHLAELVAAQVKDVVAAKQEAERANQAKSLFLANMSHELRTPLHAILGFSKLALEDPELRPETARSHFSRIVDSGERLLALLDDLLDLSKLEAGKMELDTRPTDLRALTESVIHELMPLAQAKHLRVQFQCSARDAFAELDGKRIGQVIRNVLANAFRFTPEQGSICLQLEATRMVHGRRKNDRAKVPGLKLSVLDGGPGIPDAELESIFDKFYQSSRTRTQAGGTGLGLAICREIIQLHHGNISAANRPEGGAVVAFQVPRNILDTLERPHV
jgi:PAS domain S-box-containing protein